MEETDGYLAGSQPLLVSSCVILDESLHISGFQVYQWFYKGPIIPTLLTAQILLESREVTELKYFQVYSIQLSKHLCL